MNERDIGGEEALEGRNGFGRNEVSYDGDPKVSITKHAGHRLEQRAGLKKKSLQRQVAKALEVGMGIDDTRGALRKYLLNLSRKTILYGKDPKILVHAGYVYIFTSSDTLITTWPVPRTFRRHKGKKPRQDDEE